MITTQATTPRIAPSSNGQRAVTLIELLVVLVIISLLATIAVPVYTVKVEQAKKAIAIHECREIAMAEEACATLHGFYVPLQMLDDLPSTGTVISTSSADDIINEAQKAQPYLIAIDEDINNQFATTQVNYRLTATFAVGTSDPRVINLYNKWGGPFINYQRIAYADKVKQSQNQDTAKNTYATFGYPLDPWGNPYQLYSPLGIVGTEALLTGNGAGNYNPDTNPTNSVFDGKLTATDHRTDRFAIVSFGPDGLSETYNNIATRVKDDVVYQFGGNGIVNKIY